MQAVHGDVEKVKQRLDDVNRDYRARSRLLDEFSEDYTFCSREFQIKKQAMDAFDKAVLMLEEQLKLHEKF